MALATRSIDEPQYRMQRPSQGNGDLVFRGKDASGMEVNRFRVATLDSWKTCAPVPFRSTPPNNYTSWFWQEYTLVRRAFAFLFVKDT